MIILKDPSLLCMAPVDCATSCAACGPITGGSPVSLYPAALYSFAHSCVRTSAIAAPNATDRERLKVWQWYWVGGVVTRSDLLAKLVSVWQRLSGQGDESAAVLVYSPQDATDDGTGALEAFVRDNWPMLNARLVETSLHR